MESDTNEVIVPVGRSSGEIGFYSLFGCYCSNPKHKYSFFIDEKENIYKCGFGVLKYYNVSYFLEGGFSSRLKEFNKKFMIYSFYLVPVV